jgi:glycosyltransferase involved in cell wall biosynthesis
MSSTVSVIIPAWRAADTIGAAVRSALDQTMPPLEVLAIDDGSPDDIAGALSGFPPQVRVIRQQNAGASAARNRGLEEARGTWIAFLDADDIWLPHRLAAQFEAIERHPDVRFVTGKYVLRSPTGQDVVAGPLNKFANQVLHLRSAEAFRFAGACWTGTILIHRDAIGTRRFRTDLRTAEDREFWLRILLDSPVLSLSIPVAVHQIRPGSLSTSDIDDDCRNMLRVVDMYHDQIGPEAARHWRANVYRRAASVHLKEARWRNARRAAWSRLRMEPLTAEAWWIFLRSLVAIPGR